MMMTVFGGDSIVPLGIQNRKSNNRGMMGVQCDIEGVQCDIEGVQCDIEGVQCDIEGLQCVCRQSPNPLTPKVGSGVLFMC